MSRRHVGGSKLGGEMMYVIMCVYVSNYELINTTIVVYLCLISYKELYFITKY